MTTMTNDILADEWVKKLYFENRVDLNLQIPASDESTKIQIGDIPTDPIPPRIQLPSNNQPKNETSTTPNIPTNDSYLSSILSSSNTINNDTDNKSTSAGNCKGSSDCTCYKCQRQRRRAGSRSYHNNNKNVTDQQPSSANLEKTTTTMSSSTSASSLSPSSITSTQPPLQLQRSPSSNNSLSSTILSTTSTTTPTSERSTTPTPTMSRNGSFILRKKPSVISYERHLPRPTYSEYDSIYRLHQSNNKDGQHHYSLKHGEQDDYQNQHPNDDSYQISWKDETGDDILTSLKTFQTIFDEKPYDNDGLSDLLETRAKELKLQQLHQKEMEEAMLLEQLHQSNQKPPRRHDCVTLSYRDGPQHRHLTLYHTMKMRGPSERMIAYNKALQHCIQADSGLMSWLDKHSNPASPSTINQNTRPNFLFKKSSKRSILQLPGRKQKNMAEDLWLRTTKLTDTSSTTTVIPQRSNNNNSTMDNNNNVAPIDIISTANALMPATSPDAFNQPFNKTNSNNKPYDHVDTPSRPLNRNSVDRESIVSLETENGRSQISGKIWSSLGRKSSRSRSTTPSIHSLEKVHQLPSTIQEESEAFEKKLDDLCEVMVNTNVDRSVLRKYLQQTNGDYMKTLSVLRSDVTSGKL
ncbi:unnamed protein product [Cunninghamella echinulata]